MGSSKHIVLFKELEVNYMSTIGKVTLLADENGLVTLQCDRCKSRFKMDCSYLNDELQGDICCPVCGISESLSTFWPEKL